MTDQWHYRVYPGDVTLVRESSGIVVHIRNRVMEETEGDVYVQILCTYKLVDDLL